MWRIHSKIYIESNICQFVKRAKSEMFGFDGEYRRRPTQSLGGATNCSDRETIIRKAAEERLKRNQMRRENNGATVLQSYMRSFVHRQRQKRLEREMYDVFLRQYRERLTDDENLAYLLKRIIFFYNTKNDKDNERLVGEKGKSNTFMNTN